MSIEEKNKYIEQYIRNISLQVNNGYEKKLIDEEKILQIIGMFINSTENLEKEIIPKINQSVQQIIYNFKEVKKSMDEPVEKTDYFKWNSINEKKKYELIKARNQIRQMSYQLQNTNQMQNSNLRVLKKMNNTNQGSINTLLLVFTTSFITTLITTLIYFIISK